MCSISTQTQKIFFNTYKILQALLIDIDLNNFFQIERFYTTNFIILTHFFVSMECARININCLISFQNDASPIKNKEKKVFKCLSLDTRSS